MTDYKLGDRVRMSGQVVKDRRGGSVRYVEQPVPTNGHYGERKKTYYNGIIVGKRALQEGYAARGEWDEPTYFVRDFDRPVIAVYLVAFHMSRKPSLCRPDQLTPLPDDCCGVCPLTASGRFDCTCKDNPRCELTKETVND